MTLLGESTHTKYSVCTICDIGCQLRTEVVDNEVTKILLHDNPTQATPLP